MTGKVLGLTPPASWKVEPWVDEGTQWWSEGGTVHTNHTTTKNHFCMFADRGRKPKTLRSVAWSGWVGNRHSARLPPLFKVHMLKIHTLSFIIVTGLRTTVRKVSHAIETANQYRTACVSWAWRTDGVGGKFVRGREYTLPRVLTSSDVVDHYLSHKASLLCPCLITTRCTQFTA